MPFTLAHPAILFPLAKKSRYFSGTALFIGSIVPDVEFIAQMHEGTTYSHHFPGIFLINIPLGLLLCWFFHSMVKQSLISNMPSSLQERFQFMLDLDWPAYFKSNKKIVLASLCIGIISHFAWDAFTHQNFGLLQIIPWLGRDVFFIWDTMPVYHTLQIISSVLGLVGLCYAVWRLPSSTSKTGFINYSYWLSFALFFVVMAFFRFHILPLNNGFWDVVLALMGISMYATGLNSLCHSLLPHRLMKPAP